MATRTASVLHRPPASDDEIFYPSSDGKRMADSTEQADWMVFLSSNLRSWFQKDPAVFVAVDLLWYPVQGKPKITYAPDVMVIFGRGTYPRKSYKQWEEDGIAPQVVFEIRSESNSIGELVAKSLFYRKYGVEEYYIYDPDFGSLEVILYTENEEQYVAVEYEWTSPRLGVRFEPHPRADRRSDGGSRAPMDVFYPDGKPFRTLSEQQDLTQFEQERADKEAERAALLQFERDKAQAERDKAQAERQKVQVERDAAQSAAARLEAKLREMGIDPDAL